MKIATWVWLLIAIIIIICAGIAAAIALSSPKSPANYGINRRTFSQHGFFQAAAVSSYTARDGAKLAYRAYLVPQPKKTVVLIHGSSAASISMHALAGYLQGQGMAVYVPDMRGHGDSGSKGDIAYVGQLEDDLEDFVNQVLK